MSSRAVRKALKQRALEEQLAKAALQQSNDHDDNDEAAEEDEEEENEPPAPTRAKPNLFAMLGDGDEDDDDAEEDEDDEPEEPATTTKKKDEGNATPSTSTKKKNKKKKKKKSKATAAPAVAAAEEDEIDRALKELNLKSSSLAVDGASSAAKKTTPTATSTSVGGFINDEQLQLILRVDPRNLDASQEMRKLFGRAAMSASTDDDDGAGGGRQRRGLAGRRGGIAGALAGPAGNARGLLLKKSLFVQPKDTWPNAGSGGLSMIVVNEGKEETEFRYQHSKGYQDVQRQFMMCVMSMDPNRMIALLQHNPYHISTLLQVSLILTSQRDHTTSGDLLERALYSLGRSTHTTFPSFITSPPPHPRAHLSFSRFENRELYLAIWRYIRNLCMRGTWRTSFEFGRLLYSLDWRGDPYAMVLLLDQLALKAHMPEHVLALVTSPSISKRIPKSLKATGGGGWVNLAYSTALAYHQLNKPLLAGEYLMKAITKFPWVVARLWQVLDIEATHGASIGSVLWGQVPPVDEGENDEGGDEVGGGGSVIHPLLTELYVERMRDLWNTPETISLLIDTAKNIYSLPRPKKYTSTQHLGEGESDEDALDITTIRGIPENIARHVLLSDIPSVTALLPIEWKEQSSGGAEYDPLPPPPERDLVEYNMWEGVVREGPMDVPGGDGGFEPHTQQQVGAGGMMMQFLRTLLPWVEAGGAGAGAGGQQQQQAQGDAAGNPLPPPPPPPDWATLGEILGPERAQRMRVLVEARQGLAANGGVGGANPGEDLFGIGGGEEEEDPEFVREVMNFLDGIQAARAGAGAGEGVDGWGEGDDVWNM
ncbi:transcriptional repressor TCF25-domain-containing protein [Peziza echinospora]|nr:transcriptional repressor TCF25-domain-containing protein [Peziza echinospora]